MPMYIFSIIVDDRPGVMQKIVSIFSRRAVNIDRISVGPADAGVGLARIILSFKASPEKAKFMKNLLSKTFSVKKISKFRADNAVLREMAVIRLKEFNPEIIAQIKSMFDEASVRFIDVGKDPAVEIVGNYGEIDETIKKIDPKSVREIVRSGLIALKK
ncbi:MAG: acetolactate synthase small subunit [Candidatus Odinarchaeia archaeon]